MKQCVRIYRSSKGEGQKKKATKPQEILKASKKGGRLGRGRVDCEIMRSRPSKFTASGLFIGARDYYCYAAKCNNRRKMQY